MRSKGKKRVAVAVNKDENSENWCFVCKDGGDLRICDRKDCLKSYHPECIGKDDSFLESLKYFACAWHSCFRCRKASNFHCYTCTNAVCRRCFTGSDFLQVKGMSGFCSLCLRLVLLIEDDKGYDSDGNKVDFKDRETCEGLYCEYYVIIKEQEGFEVRDIYAARNRKEKENHPSGSSSEEFEGKDTDDDDDEESQTDDYFNDDGNDDDDDDDDEDEEYGKKKKFGVKEKGSSEKMSAIKNALTSSNTKFPGWCSNFLMDFLRSIGKSTSEKLSQNEVTSIVNQYIKEKNLFHPKRKRMIVCDERLLPLLRRKLVSRFRVYDLLGTHFSEEEDVSEADEDEDSDNDSDDLIKSKRKRKLDSEQKNVGKTGSISDPGSCFASITVENMKLIYLRRSLLRELLVKDPESFKEKVIGCYARVKSSLCRQHSRNFHRLVQVKGVKPVSTSDCCLALSDTWDEVSISQLSDEDLCAEECEELRQTMEAGHLERPTVEEIQRKAEVLHEDITSNWINKEVGLLNKLIERANEKGWRRELFEYLERRKKLENPTEKLKLLRTLPIVVPEMTATEVPSDSEETSIAMGD